MCSTRNVECPMKAKGGLTQIKRLDSKLPYATDLIAAFGFETETEELIKLGHKMPFRVSP